MDSSSRLLFDGPTAKAMIVPPDDEAASRLVIRTINETLEAFTGLALPVEPRPHGTDLAILAGNLRNHDGVRALYESGVVVAETDSLGDEGFRLLTVSGPETDAILILGNTPAALKHGCQELVYFRLSITEPAVRVDWPLDVIRVPAFAYRGVYMLPCWAAHDSVDHWKAVLRFHSELTLNRNWFWVAGFPLMPDYGGEYAELPLADPWAIRDLIELCHAEGMKLMLGGGWFNWHHEGHSGGNLERGVQYYRDLLDCFPEADGLYIEPTGEGRAEGREVWGEQVEAMKGLFEGLLAKRPDLEFAIAIGQFNADEYLRIAHEMAGGGVHWWWCWGDPLRDGAHTRHDRVLRWHTCQEMSEFHGSLAPPRPEERALTGFATSYDPGMGFGNPWNGWGKLGVEAPREFDPRTMPYFSHQYRFRERCWDPEQTEAAFAARLRRRLFDEDQPADCVDAYLELAGYCFDPSKAAPARLDELEAFAAAGESVGTPRNRDTFARMREALAGLRSLGG